jgi:hypothetical protein
MLRRLFSSVIAVLCFFSFILMLHGFPRNFRISRAILKISKISRKFPKFSKKFSKFPKFPKKLSKFPKIPKSDKILEKLRKFPEFFPKFPKIPEIAHTAPTDFFRFFATKSYDNARKTQETRRGTAWLKVGRRADVSAVPKWMNWYSKHSHAQCQRISSSTRRVGV